MKPSRVIALLEWIQEQDKLERERSREGKPQCLDCGLAAFDPEIRPRPAWHRYQRFLCPDCEPKYLALLKAIGAVDGVTETRL